MHLASFAADKRIDLGALDIIGQADTAVAGIFNGPNQLAILHAKGLAAIDKVITGAAMRRNLNTFIIALTTLRIGILRLRKRCRLVLTIGKREVGSHIHALLILQAHVIARHGLKRPLVAVASRSVFRCTDNGKRTVLGEQHRTAIARKLKIGIFLGKDTGDACNKTEEKQHESTLQSMWVQSYFHNTKYIWIYNLVSIRMGGAIPRINRFLRVETYGRFDVGLRWRNNELLRGV